MASPPALTAFTEAALTIIAARPHSARVDFKYDAEREEVALRVTDARKVG